MNYITTSKHPSLKNMQVLTWVESAGCWFLNLNDDDAGNNIPIQPETIKDWLKLGYIKEYADN